jgi:hypothetical protein
VAVEAPGHWRQMHVVAAMLVAHLQMMVNRTKKGLGRRGLVWTALAVVVLLGLTAPVFTAFGVLGHVFGRHLSDARVPTLMGLVLTGMTLAFGIAGGLFGGARQLTWDAYRSLPVPFHLLFIAETIASAFDLVTLAFIGALGAIAGAFTWQVPLAAPLVALLYLQLTASVLFIQHLVGTLAVASVRSLRGALLVLMAATWLATSVFVPVATSIRGDLQDPELLRLRSAWRVARPVLDRLPPVASVRAIAALAAGDPVGAASGEVAMLVFTAALGVLSYALLRRETRPAVTVAEAATTRGATARAMSPRRAIAELHLRYLRTSIQGRFGLIVPIISVVLIKGPLAVIEVRRGITLPGAVLYVALASTQLHCNQFGLDGLGAKAWFLLPIDGRDVLLGKAGALVAYATIQNAILFALVAILTRPDGTDVVAGSLLAASLTVAGTLAGHWASIVFPRPLSFGRMNATGLSGANLLPLGVGLASGVVFGGLYGLASLASSEYRNVALAALLTAVIAAYWALLPRVARFLERRREAIVEAMG